jgi:ABC-type amino acid transport substrate-binding protein
MNYAVRSILLVCVLICFQLMTVSTIKQAHADAQDTPVLNVATIPLPPWGFKTDDNKHMGVCYEWANAIAERMGRKINNRVVPMNRLFKMLEHGQADFAIFLRTPFSAKFADPVAYTGIPLETVIWPRKGIHVEKYDDLKDVLISMARGLRVGGDFSKNEANLKIVPSVSYEQSIQLFKAKRVDAIVGTKQSLIYNAKKLGIDVTTEFDDPFVVDHLEGWIQASKQFSQREGIEELQKASQSLIDDGTFQKIYEKYQNYSY